MIDGTGSSGTLVLDFVDANDTVQVVAASEISGFTIIEVRHGTVDFTALGWVSCRTTRCRWDLGRSLPMPNISN